ncbi:MAG: protein phosphatase 2C domain-containing protein [Rhodobacter sp.]|nr:protein phosphatase 2C domain-containing protein [Rhodobacter sp.]
MPDPQLEIDAACALHLGNRDTQEDAIASDFPIGGGCGLVVLADGMGGHTAGEIASKIAVTEVYSELKLLSSDLVGDGSNMPNVLRRAVESANECLRGHSEAHPAMAGMGTTLVAIVQISDALHWISIGDSLLLLFRHGKLRRLNADHSLAPQIDLMVKKGELQQEVAAKHPQRNCLTSAMTGEPIPRIDCPHTPLRLLPDDVIIVSSDGLQALPDDSIARVLAERSEATSNQIAKALLNAVIERDDPEQDNLACAVAKVVNPQQNDIEALDGHASQALLANVANGGAKTDTRVRGSYTPQPPIMHRLRRLTGGLFW